MTTGKTLHTANHFNATTYLTGNSLRKLALSDSHFAELLEAAQINVWDWDLATNEVIDCGYSASLAVLAGYDAHKKYPGRIEHFLKRLHPDDRERVQKLLETSFSQHVDYAAEFRIQLQDGHYEWVAARGRYLYDDHNIPIKMIGSWRFITEQKKNATTHPSSTSNTCAPRARLLIRRTGFHTRT